MTPYTEAKAFQLLSFRDGPNRSVPEFHLELHQALFFSFSRTGAPEGSNAAGFAIPIAALSSPRTLELASEALRMLGISEADATCKLVGEQSSIDAAKPVLRATGIKKFDERPRALGIGLELLYAPATGRVRVAKVIPSANKTETKTRVLIVDDSKTIRTLLERILSSDPGVEVVGSAEKPSDAEKLISKLKPDVITLDIHMPEMDGVTFLKKYLPRHPIPTVMISSISLEEGPMVLSALEAGAVDYVQKPTFEQIKEVAPVILEKVKQARHAKIQVRSRRPVSPQRPQTAKKASVNLSCDLSHTTIVAVGSSTGGTEALRQVFERLPAEIPPILVVQHIPPVFSKAFADRMNELCPFEVREAVDGDIVAPNRVLIAPGGTQMSLRKTSSGFTVKVDPTAGPVNRHKPSVDVLFDAVAELFAARAVGVILTGMGTDGAKGLLKMKKAGAITLGQDEPSSVVYGMPRAAFELGAVDRQYPLDDIANAIVDALSKKKRAA